MKEEDPKDTCMRWRRSEISVCLTPEDLDLLTSVREMLKMLKMSSIYHVPLQGFLRDYKDIQITENYPSGCEHRMITLTGMFKTLQFNPGDRLVAVVDRITSEQIVCLYETFWPVILYNDMSGSWIGAELTVGQEVHIKVLALSQSSNGRYCIKGDILALGEKQIVVMQQFNQRTESSVSAASSNPAESPSHPLLGLVDQLPEAEQFESVVKSSMDTESSTAEEEDAKGSSSYKEEILSSKRKNTDDSYANSPKKTRKEESNDFRIPAKSAAVDRKELPPGFEFTKQGKKKKYFMTENPGKLFHSVNSCWEHYDQQTCASKSPKVLESKRPSKKHSWEAPYTQAEFDSEEETAPETKSLKSPKKKGLNKTVIEETSHSEMDEEKELKKTSDAVLETEPGEASKREDDAKKDDTRERPHKQKKLLNVENPVADAKQGSKSPLKSPGRDRYKLPPGFESCLKGERKKYFMSTKPNKLFRNIRSCWDYFNSQSSVSESVEVSGIDKLRSNTAESPGKPKAREEELETDDDEARKSETASSIITDHFKQPNSRRKAKSESPDSGHESEALGKPVHHKSGSESSSDSDEEKDDEDEKVVSSPQKKPGRILDEDSSVVDMKDANEENTDAESSMNNPAAAKKKDKSKEDTINRSKVAPKTPGRGRFDLPPGFEYVQRGKGKKKYFRTVNPGKFFHNINSCWEFYNQQISASESAEGSNKDVTKSPVKPKVKDKIGKANSLTENSKQPNLASNSSAHNNAPILEQAKSPKKKTDVKKSESSDSEPESEVRGKPSESKDDPESCSSSDSEEENEVEKETVREDSPESEADDSGEENKTDSSKSVDSAGGAKSKSVTAFNLPNSPKKYAKTSYEQSKSEDSNSSSDCEEEVTVDANKIISSTKNPVKTKAEESSSDDDSSEESEKEVAKETNESKKNPKDAARDEKSKHEKGKILESVSANNKGSSESDEPYDDDEDKKNGSSKQSVGPTSTKTRLEADDSDSSSENELGPSQDIFAPKQKSKLTPVSASQSGMKRNMSPSSSVLSQKPNKISKLSKTAKISKVRDPTRDKTESTSEMPNILEKFKPIQEVFKSPQTICGRPENSQNKSLLLSSTFLSSAVRNQSFGSKISPIRKEKKKKKKKKKKELKGFC